jgi:hypothetical protein
MHLFKAELFSGVEFDEENNCRGCLQCNYEPDGNFEPYKEGYIKRYSRLQFDLLEARATSTRLIKRSRPELIEIIETYRTKIKELKTAA